MRLQTVSALAGCLCLLPVVAGAAFPSDDDLVVVSGPASPRVAYALRRGRRTLTLVVDIAADDGTTVGVGLSAAKTVRMSNADAKVRHVRDAARYTFTIPAKTLVSGEADWARLRMGLAVAWRGGPFGQDRQRERFRHIAGAPHLALSADPADWLPLDIREYEALVADRRKRIVFDFVQPMDGKATVVIENEEGGRVRNLIAGRPMARGRHRIGWDGLDEAGNIVTPGRYRWRAISHPGVRPEYLFSFCNDGKPPWRDGSGTCMWGPDHSTLTAAAAGK